MKIIIIALGTYAGFVKPVANSDAAVARMNALLNDTFVALPNVTVLLASLIGSTDAYGGQLHAKYNAALPSLASLHRRKGENVVFVDMAKESAIGTKCDAADCCPVHIHPNDKGYRKMGSVWQKSILAMLR